MIPIFRPSIGDAEIKSVTDTLRSGWLGMGPRTKEFEAEFAKYIGVDHAIGLNSGTAALHLAANLLDLGSAEVITTPITFVSTAHVILYAGAQPVFADVQEDTLNLDPRDVERKLTSKTKAVIPVHYGGHPCDMDEIMALAASRGLHVIEDAAHACGAEYKGKKAGSIGEMGCFSFHAVKNLCCGDGGMITTRDERLRGELVKLRWVGIDADTYQRNTKKGYGWYYEVQSLGFKEHMNDITASLGLAQLRRLEAMNQRRRDIVKLYQNEFKGLDWLQIPYQRSYVKSSWHLFPVRLVKGDRNSLIAHLADRGVSAGVHYMPLYLHPYYKKLGIKADCPVADRVWKQLVDLPLYPDMTESDIEQVTEAVKDFGRVNA